MVRVRVLHGRGAAGDLHPKGGVVVGRVGVAVNGLHAAPVGVQLFGQHHGQASMRALAEFQAVDGDGDRAVARDLHKGGGLLVGLEARGRWRCALLSVRHEGIRAQRETRGGGDLQEAAARDAFERLGVAQAVRQRGWHVGANLFSGVVLEVHESSFQASERAASLMAMRTRA
jgi:hypothetical protein